MIIETKFDIGQRLFMIPTISNRLKHIVEYELLSIELMGIGLRYHLSIIKKESGVEPFYLASEEMFEQSIFATKSEAEEKLKELQNEKQ